jgi:hypothetical protein
VSAESDARAESVVFHELAGLLSSLWSISEMVAQRPDHPEREEFISLLRAEARKAARTFKDLQNLRALMADNFAERIETVRIADVLEGADALGDAQNARRSTTRDDITLRADMFALAEFIARLRDLAVEFGGDGNDGVEARSDQMDLVYSCGTEDRHADLLEGIDRGDGRARVLYVMRRVVLRWGGDVRVETRDGGAAVTVRLRRSGT